ncbi:peroxidase family protein [Spirosoma foliorum]|uniref:Heme peroxidase n=1 Tax=Spirosoma foliorum TaxID=2710596 RepID=A0A7G5GRK7_9BACT|nr:heme peroxidase family protein [Spirosoma foliorum]QMW01499.1 heme peroxidase [Spirosoma foliorum]
MATLNLQRPNTGHGAPLRGLDSTVNSTLFQGRFGRIFRNLPPAVFKDDDLLKLATAMTAEQEKDPVTHLPAVTEEAQNDDEENFGIPAGYTYFGQFIDHDITFDPMSIQIKQTDPDGLVDFRTPALDLDNLYGRGPSDQPYLYEPDGRKFLLSDRFLTGGDPERNLTRDLPRFHQRALIGDKRNDENVIVSQLQGLFLRFHNHLADLHPTHLFEQIQKSVQWHYQWLVLFDFLPRIVGRSMVEAILPHLKSGKPIHEDKPKLNFFHWKEKPFMPVEFSVAAYRFGHSMVRPVYRLSAKNLPSQTIIQGLDHRKMVFAPVENDGLNGFREFPSDWGIDWNLFFETANHKLSPDTKGPTRVQPAYKIDSSLVSPLGALPEFSIKGTSTPVDVPGSVPARKEINMLALRNLIRGSRLGLPSGQDVARQMGYTPISDVDLLVGKANTDGLPKGKDQNSSIANIAPAFVGKAPLWFYILAEAQHEWVKAVKNLPTDDAKNNTPIHLGPVGGRIVAEVLIGLMWGDGDSFLSSNATFVPEFGNPKAVSVFDKFTMGDLISLIPPIK